MPDTHNHDRRTLEDRRVPEGERPENDTRAYLMQQLSLDMLDLKRDLETHIHREESQFTELFRALHELAVAQNSKPVFQTYGLWEILNHSVAPTKLFSVLLYLLAAFGVVLQASDGHAGALGYLFSLMPFYSWVYLLVFMAASRSMDLFWWPGNRVLNMVVPALGVWIWTMVFVSSIVMTPIESMGGLHVVPILMELWIATKAFLLWRGRPWV